MEKKDVTALLSAAFSAREQAYAPYSRFSVGAAIMTEDGRIYKGCNVENASYPAGLCAERCAIGAAVAEGKRAFKAIAIVGSEAVYTTPCGICRQVLHEFHVSLVICARTREDYLFIEGENLLPHAFDDTALHS